MSAGRWEASGRIRLKSCLARGWVERSPVRDGTIVGPTEMWLSNRWKREHLPEPLSRTPLGGTLCLLGMISRRQRLDSVLEHSWRERKERFNVVVDLIVLARGKVRSCQYEAVSSTFQSTHIIYNLDVVLDAIIIPGVETPRWRSIVPFDIFCHRLLQRFALSCQQSFPFGSTLLDEELDRMLCPLASYQLPASSKSITWVIL